MDNSENTLQPAGNTNQGSASRKLHSLIHEANQNDSKELRMPQNAGDTKSRPIAFSSTRLPVITPAKRENVSQPLSDKERDASRPLPIPIKPGNASQPLPIPIKPGNASQSIAPHKRDGEVNTPLPINLPDSEMDIFLDLNLEDSKTEALSSEILDCIPDVGEFDPLSSDLDVASLLAVLKEDDNPSQVAPIEAKTNTSNEHSEIIPREDAGKKADKKDNFQIFKAPNVFQSVIPRKDSVKESKEDAEKASKSQPLAASPDGLKNTASQKDSGEKSKEDAEKANKSQPLAASPDGLKNTASQKDLDEKSKEDAEKASKSQPLAASPDGLKNTASQKDSGEKSKEDAEKASKSQPLAASPDGLKNTASQKDSDEKSKEDADQKNHFKAFKVPSGIQANTSETDSEKSPKEDADKVDHFRAFRTKPEFKSNSVKKDSETSPKEDADKKDGTQPADAFLAIESRDNDTDTSSEFSVSAGILAIGAVVQQRYKIIDVIGEGGFATVYHADDFKDGREVALKVMDPKKGIDTTYTERFFREAKIAAKIHHDNVVSIYDFGRIDETGQPYIAMELLKGHALNDEISENGPLTPKRAFSLIRPVLDALATGHRLGIVHKDLKPENLYLVSPGTPKEILKILDFGVARIQSEVTRLTSDGLIFGTPRYLAPEYIRSQVVSPAVDVYQMALIFSEILTGIPAVSGEPYQVMMLHCSGQIQIADFLLEGEVGRVFRKALSIHPEDRYPDCEALGKAFDSIADYFTSDEKLKAGKNGDSLQKSTNSVRLLNESPLPGNEPKKQEDSAADDLPKEESSIKEEQGKQEEPKKTEDPVPNENHEKSDESAPKDGSEKSDKLASLKDNKFNLIYLLLGAVIVVFIIIICIIVFSNDSPKEEPSQVAETSVAVPPADKIIEFSFTSDPPGARVIRSGAFPVCSPTPCKAQFHESDLNLAQLIDFELDGYRIAHYELKKTSYEETKGLIHVALNKEERLSTVTFTLNYEPADAVVTEMESQNVVCTSSPCTYIFELDRGYVKLKFEADGYHEQVEDLTKRRFDETHGNVQVALSKGRRGGKRSSGASGGDVEALCQKAVRAKVNGKKCEAYQLYRRAKKAGIKDALCQRNADSTIGAYAAECNK